MELTLDFFSIFRYTLCTMRVILVHGFNADPTMNFHQWLANELRDRGFEVLTPTLSLKSGDELDPLKIIEELKTQVGFLKKDDILLGHSLGGVVVLRYLEAAEMTETPRAVILVASPWKVARPDLRHFFLDELDTDVVMWKAREFVVIHSTDDKLVPIEHGKKLAEVLKARFIQTNSDDHFMAEQYSILLQTIEDIATHPHEYEPGNGLSNVYEEKPVS